jgi:regulator of protease activity HflC (stomatin/prohibitin superfamily)
MRLTGVIGGIIAFLFACVLLSTCTLVRPTEAGFKINKAGDYRGVENLPLVTGYNFYVPWMTEIKTIPTTMQHVVWSSTKDEGDPADQAIPIACSGGAGFKVDVGLNYHVNANDAPKIYLRWKETDLSDITSKFLRNLTRGTMQDVSGHMSVDSILDDLPGFESQVRDSLTIRMHRFGFIVDNYNVLHRPTPSDPALNNAINAKINARIEAEKKVMELQSSVAEANKLIAKARGDSASQVIEALGRAEAIRAMQQQLTPTFVDYLRAQQWDGHLPTTMLGGGSNTLFSLK